jgi:dihydroflavonol-4-reductase
VRAFHSSSGKSVGRFGPLLGLARPVRSVVVGAAGYLGVNLVEELIAAGETPTCVRRRTTNVLPLRKKPLTMVIADADDPASLRDAFIGADVVYNLAGHYPRTARTPEASMTLATRQMQNVLDAAAACEVPRLVYVSSTGTVRPRPDGRPATERDVYDERPGHGLYHDLKWTLERMALDEKRFEVHVACPGACIGPWDLRVGTTALLVGAAHGKLPPLPAGIVNPVYTRDVARALRRLGTLPDAPKRVLLAGANVELHPFLSAFAGRFGAAPPPPPIAPHDAVAFADAEELRTEGTTERPAIARELVDLIVHGGPIDAGLAERALDLTWTPLDVVLDDYASWAGRLRILPPPLIPLPIENPHDDTSPDPR